MLKLNSATAIIAMVTVAASAVVLLFMNLGVVATYWGFTPAVVGVNLTASIAIPWWLTPFSSALLHGGWLHLIGNMAMLLLAGLKVERVIGASGFLLAYIAGAVAGAAAQYAAGPGSIIPMIGASGAISAIIGLYGIFYGRPPQVSGNQKLNRAVHVAWMLAAWVLFQLLLGYLAARDGVLIAIPAHIGGFAAGLLLHRPLLLWHYRKA